MTSHFLVSAANLVPPALFLCISMGHTVQDVVFTPHGAEHAARYIRCLQSTFILYLYECGHSVNGGWPARLRRVLRDLVTNYRRFTP